MIGERLGSYRVVDKLGEGGMGEVYRAVDEMLDRDVALKMLKPELARRPGTLERFRAEAITLAKLDHPGIARIHGISRHDDLWFIVMELVGGETLHARLRRHGRLAWSEAVPILCQLLDALEYAHRRGVVHRDLKPANVLVDETNRVKVTDFGIARVLGTERATRTGHVVGTLEYMAPEQVRGEDVDGRSDLYAVGVLLYELVTGKVPFTGSSEYEVMMQHLQAPIPSAARAVPHLPAWFDGVFQRVLAKARTDRFSSAAEFQTAIEMLAAAEPMAVQINPSRPGVPRPPIAPVIPRSTDPEATVATRLAMTGAPLAPATLPPTRLAPPEAPQTRLADPAAAAIPPTKLASEPVAPPPAPVPVPPMPGLSWKVVTAGAALIVVLVAVTSVVGWRMLRDPGRQQAANDGVLPPGPLPPPVPQPHDDGVGGGGPTPPQPEPQDPIVIGGGGVGPLPGPTPKPAPPGPGGPRGGGANGPVTPVQPGPTPPTGGNAPAPSPPNGGANGSAPVEPRPDPPKEEAREPEEEKDPKGSDEAGAIEFEEVMLRGANGSELEVMLFFESKRLVVTDPDNEKVVRSIPYGNIGDATYTKGRRSGMLRRASHWLEIQAGGAQIVFKVDGGEVEQMVSALEQRGHLKVKRVNAEQ
jgi:serine/threonine-protein kinase